MKCTLAALTSVWLIAGLAGAQPVLDGSAIDSLYGPALVVQDTQTNWFYRGADVWTPDAAEAFDFQYSAGGAEFTQKMELADTQLVVVLPVDKPGGRNTLLDLTKEGAAVSAGSPERLWRGSDRVLTEIKLKKGESVDKALRRLKKRIDREGTLKIVRNHRHYEKPSERRRRKEKVARFSAMLSARYADL